MEQIDQIKDILSNPKDIVVTSHRNPDGDAIGAALAIYHFLRKLGHFPTVIVPSEFPEFLAWMDGSDKILIYDYDTDESKAAVEKAEVVFYLDFNSLDRIDKLGELTDALSCPKFMIDHHLYPEPIADFMISDTSASSTCEMIFDFMVELGYRHLIDLSIGECLYAGIVTDTGSFKFSTSPKLFRVVADLVEIGVDDYALQDLIFNCLNEKQLRLLGHCLSKRMEILEDLQTGIIFLTKGDYEYFDIQRGDTEGIVNFLLKMKNVKVAAFITQQPTIIKISLRSKGDFSVQEIARKHFKGGGHRNASGGFAYGSIHSVIKKFKKIIAEYKPELNSVSN